MKTESFPLTVSERGVSAVIRKSEKNKGGKIHHYFIVEYFQRGRRKQVWRSGLDAAKTIASAACLKIANGEQSALELKDTDRLAYLRASEFSAKVGLPLDVIVQRLAECLEVLGDQVTPLEACRDWVKRNAVALPKITVSGAAVKFNAEAETEKSHLRQKALAWTMTHLEAAFGTSNVDFLTPDLISRHLSSLKLSERSKKNHRDSIGFFNRWLILRGYLPKGTDLLEHVQDYSARKLSEIEIYTPGDVARLLRAAGDMTPFFAIAAFAGLRHAEIARLDWREIDLQDGFIEVLATKSKTGERRLVPIHDNLKQWLLPYRPASGVSPVTPYANTAKQVLKVARVAGVEWKHNALRHSFISYRVAECGQKGIVAEEAGNSPAMIRQHYLRRVKPSQAAEWFGIVPEARP